MNRKYITVAKTPQQIGYQLYYVLMDGERKCRALEGDWQSDEIAYRDISEFESWRPLASLNDTEAQVLMDSLYSSGIRPTDGKDNSNLIERMNDHLQDMRQVVFSKLQIDKP